LFCLGSFLTFTQVAQILEKKLHYFLPKWFWLHFGPFFHKLFWSPCSRIWIAMERFGKIFQLNFASCFFSPLSKPFRRWRSMYAGGKPTKRFFPKKYKILWVVRCWQVRRLPNTYT
jgi:hypothetical protein